MFHVSLPGVLAALTAAVWLVGQVFRDVCWWTAICFYVPSALAAVVLVLCAGAAWWRANQRLAWACAGLALGPASFVAFVENQWTAPAAQAHGSGPYRLVHWNVQSGGWSWSGIEQTLVSLQPDLVVLSEAPQPAALDSLAVQLGADFRPLRTANLAVLAREPLVGERFDMPQGEAHLVGWRNRRLLIVDLPSNPWIERDPLLQAVHRHMEEARPDIIVGDFNAPRRSRRLSELPAGYVHAYEQAGSGWSYTWPMPCPLWAIDQCLLGPRVTAIRYQLHSTLASDHRLQVLDFTVRE